jgi:hypothetical protein
MLLAALTLALATSASAFSMVRGFHAGPEHGNLHQAEQPDEAWLAYLDRLNVEWVGVMIAIFSADLVDVTVHTRQRPTGDDDWKNGYTFTDAQLAGLTKALHARGKKVYWTLAAEQPRFDFGTGDPNYIAEPVNCGQPTYNVPRYQWEHRSLPSSRIDALSRRSGSGTPTIRTIRRRSANSSEA